MKIFLLILVLSLIVQFLYFKEQIRRIITTITWHFVEIQSIECREKKGNFSYEIIEEDWIKTYCKPNEN